jgi:hypothetical protein
MPSVPSRAGECDRAWSFGPLEDSPQVLAEALAMPALHLSELPVATRFILQGHGITREMVWSTNPAARPWADDGRISFTVDEVLALALGAQAERLWSSDLKGYCLRKLHDPSFLVTEGLALGGAEPDRGRPWSLGRVLRWLDLELVGIELAAEGAKAATSVAA